MPWLTIGNRRTGYDPDTGESGSQIRLLNKTGGNTTKGYLIEAASGEADRGFDYVAVNDPDPCGVVYDVVADDAECWIWVNGLVQVYYTAAVSIGQFARVTVTADTGDAAGLAIGEAVPSSPFSTDKHFQEVGHIFETTGGAGLALTNIHFN